MVLNRVSNQQIVNSCRKLPEILMACEDIKWSRLGLLMKKRLKFFFLQAHKSLFTEWDILNLVHCGSRMVCTSKVHAISVQTQLSKESICFNYHSIIFLRVRSRCYRIGTHFLMLRKFPTQCFEGGSVLKKWHEFRKSTTCHGDDHNIAKPGKK